MNDELNDRWKFGCPNCSSQLIVWQSKMTSGPVEGDSFEVQCKDCGLTEPPIDIQQVVKEFYR